MLEDVLKTNTFLDNEFTKEYLEIVNCSYSGKGEVHHILPRSIFPEYTNCDWNKVNLSYKDHYRVHCLLPNMVVGKARASMLYAWNIMSNRHQDAVDPAQSYEDFRKELNAIISEANTGRVASPESVEAARLRMLGENNHQFGKRGELSPNYGKIGPNKGRVWSEETLLKFSAANKGENNNMFGKKHTDETKRKISEANSGERSHQYGKTTTDKQKAAARLTCLTRERTAEEREKIAAARRIPVLIDGIVYISAKDAADYFGLAKTTVSSWTKTGKATKLPPNWKELPEYKDLPSITCKLISFMV